MKPFLKENPDKFLISLAIIAFQKDCHNLSEYSKKLEKEFLEWVVGSHELFNIYHNVVLWI